MHDSPAERPKTHLRRRRYAGKNPREYHEKYKELNPAQYPGEVEKVLAAGKTPAGTHRPIMVDEVLECLRRSRERWAWTARSAEAVMHAPCSNVCGLAVGLSDSI